jgi:tetratricopeptide (TPR) repeat protein
LKLKCYGKAFVIFEKSLQINPHEQIALNSYGKALADLGNYEKAYEIYERSLQINPHDPIALTSYGKALADSGNYEKAFEIFERSLQINPHDLIALNSYGKALANSENYEKAYEIYERSLQINPHDPIALNSYGKALADSGNYEKAFEIFERSLQINPHNLIALNSYGKALANSENYEKAYEIYERSLQINPHDLIALASYIKVLTKIGKYEKLTDIYEQISLINQKEKRRLKGYGLELVKTGNYEKATEILAVSSYIYPDDVMILVGYGKALLKIGNTEKVLEIHESFLQTQSDNVIALNSYGKALAESGNYEKAYGIYEQSLQLEPNNIITLNSYGKALAESGNYEKAYGIYEQSLQINPNDLITLTSYGKALAESGNYDKAYGIYEQSLQLEPNNIITLTSYGKALVESGNYKKSCDIFERFLQIKADNYISFIYARCLEHLGKYTDAISQLKAIDFESLPQYYVNIHISLGRLYYCLKLYEEGDKYFNLAIANSDDKEKSILSSARSILAHNPHNETAVKMLQQIAEESPRYSQALEMLTLNLSEEEYFKMVKSDYQSGVNDTEILNRAIYHKIANEISILKGIAYRILRFSQTEDPLLTGIINDIENVLEEVNRRRALEKSQIATISNNEYEQILAIISKTAHDISDFVNNELAIIESKTRRAMRKIAVDDSHYKQFEKLLTQLKFTQIALNDLKAINEGIKIKNHHFKIKKLFEKWEANPHIDNASITLDIANGDSEFNGDEEKIKSILNELVENSLKHNAKKLDLNISISTEDIINPPGIRGANIPGEQKYLLIEFNDNGQGVPPDKKDWIFQPLKTTASEGHGSGLGLFIIRKTLTQMNGHIQETGWKGAKFKIYIPYTKSENVKI